MILKISSDSAIYIIILITPPFYLVHCFLRTPNMSLRVRGAGGFVPRLSTTQPHISLGATDNSGKCRWPLSAMVSHTLVFPNTENTPSDEKPTCSLLRKKQRHTGPFSAHMMCCVTGSGEMSPLLPQIHRRHILSKALSIWFSAHTHTCQRHLNIPKRRGPIAHIFM